MRVKYIGPVETTTSPAGGHWDPDEVKDLSESDAASLLGRYDFEEAAEPIPVEEPSIEEAPKRTRKPTEAPATEEV